jgi:hypothetical protein
MTAIVAPPLNRESAKRRMPRSEIPNYRRLQRCRDIGQAKSLHMIQTIVYGKCRTHLLKPLDLNSASWASTFVAIIIVSFDSRRTPPDDLDVGFAQRRARLEALHILPLSFKPRAFLPANLTTDSPHHSLLPPLFAGAGMRCAYDTPCHPDRAIRKGPIVRPTGSQRACRL